ncbi:helicase-related protein [Clostridium beijerinckii]|uniref:RNA polymerase-associated protein RapA n=1 Tax=Clostridium beijerinckii TaxID=1520 RepID=A0A1S8S2R9_CLOBE|nr:helicase-related protein [Clostridium beijerinckii]NRY63838.1 SNF2 family DNA or RNA helicase [Clostridium beijerinckii]OOM59756.1 RNA polymerase-associated protein RapA [Clostridium beijerinckii]
MKALDNKLNKVGDELKDNITKGSKISIIASYFSIYAFKELRKELNKIEELRFIFTEPMFLEHNETQRLDYSLENRNWEMLLSGNKYELKLRNELTQSLVAKECADWIRNKVSLKSSRFPGAVGSKFIHIKNKNQDDLLINNTNDFSASGLGYTNSDQMIFANSISNNPMTDQMLQMFDMFWDNNMMLEDVKAKVLESIENIYKENTPEYLYFVTLYNIFRDYLDELTEDNIVKSRTGFKDTVIWDKLYKFQKDGVLGAIDKLEKYNGCIIADSVGLGKTFSALAVIKYYELRNDRVLVLCPKKLRDNWIVYTQNDKRNLLVNDRFNYDVLNHTDLSRDHGMSGDIDLSTINWSNYDLIVIDESHNFRNNAARNNSETRYSKLMNEVIKKGVKTKVLMLSATPVNNRMNDIKNQIAFMTEGNDDAFSECGIRSIEQTLKKAQTIFNRWTNLEESARTLDNFLEQMNSDYFKLLDTVTIARSRKHIEKYYNIKEIGRFPERILPLNIKSDIDLKGEFPKLEEINKEIMRLKLAAYSPLSYVLSHKKEEYNRKYDIEVKGGASVFKQTDRENSIIHLMRASILKRMESSIHSFGLTIAKILKQIDNLINKIDNDYENYDPTLDINDINIEDSDLETLLIGNKVKVLIQDIDKIKWKQDLEYDRERLEHLLFEAAKVTKGNDDAKLNDLKMVLDNKIMNPLNEGNKKIIIFTAFADTAEYLYEKIMPWAKEKYSLYSALVVGAGANKTNLKGIRTDLSGILTNFSPRSKERDKINPDMTEQLDILIATDCISEGQNLQDCDFLINYDIHWNPVRIIQRFGRIDRIGSINDKIQLVNFWPNMELDEYINLEARVSGRMVLLDISATGEENIISFDEKKKMNDLEYRKKQLKKLQEEVVDLEDISGGISITDLTLNDFKMDLIDYLNGNREELEKAPKGMHAIVNIPDVLQGQVKPGVIFCLRQINDNEKVKEFNNSLHPNYLVYVKENGQVMYNHMHNKKILDYYKKLCSGNDLILRDLVQEFYEETSEGKNMSKYSELLEIGIRDIIGKKEEQGIMSLFSSGGTNLAAHTFKSLEDFELVSFLIIK